MKEIVQLMEEQLNVGDLRERMYRAPTPREPRAMPQPDARLSRWLRWTDASYHWKLAGQLSPRRGPRFGFEQTVPPPVLNWGLLKSAVQSAWRGGRHPTHWKVVRQFLKQSFDLGLSRSSCLNYLHRGLRYEATQETPPESQGSARKAF